ncbi:GAF domain-containing protein [Pseudanabaena yagii]|uniref:histidine kinase n=1 Tax=Pseudanabaena yagii GIHE-NHR1 TaxID=2722753 RepID=A0ABX1LSR7_9CYAN|nr:GAF domain-containing protein [Pseudanabaena yagii]NMF57864.1 PAS domain S-box protein [Pseudanabaena yagii GIHE-NHR1]
MITSTLRLSELKLAIIHEPLEVPADATVMQAIALMSSARSQCDAANYSDNQQQQLQQEARSSCVLVLENQQVIGILSERDVVRLTAQQQPMDHLVIREVMHTPVFMVKLDELLGNVQKLIYGHALRAVIVVGDRGELIGIVTQTSFLQALNSLEKSNLSESLGSGSMIARQKADLEARNALLAMTHEELQCTIEELRVSTEELIVQHRQNEYEHLRYQNLFDFAPDGYLVTDSSGKILEANQAVLEMLAISHEYILGKPFIVFIDTNHIDLFYNQLNYFLSPEHIKISEEMNLITHQGKNFPAEITITQNINLLDRSIQLLWMVRDISDRKHAEQELQLANQSLELKVKERTQDLWQVNKLQRAILDSADYAIISTDLNGIIQTFNAGAEKMFGYSMGEVIGKITPEIFFDHQELIDRSSNILPEGERNTWGFRSFLAMASQGILSNEWINIRKDGSRFPVELSVTSLKDDDEKTIGFLSVRKDISDRKQAEQTILQQANQEALLRGITQRIRQSLDLPIIFDTACQEIQQLLQCDRVGIFKFYPESNFDDGEFVAEAVVDGFSSAMEEHIHDHCFGENYAAVYAQGRVQVVNDIDHAGLTDCHRDVLARFQVRANLVIPLLCGNDLWGLLCIHQCAHTRQWQEREIDLIQQIANQLTIAIQQADLYEQLHAELLIRQQAEAKISIQLRRQQILEEITQQIRESLDIQEILATVTQKIQDALYCDRVIVFQLFADGRSQIVEESVHSDFPTLKDMSWEDEVWSQEVLDDYWQGIPRIVPDVMNDVWTECLVEYSVEGRIQSKIVAPIIQDTHIDQTQRWVTTAGTKKLWGVLVVHACAERRIWQESEAQLLQQVANQLAIAIQQATLFEQSQQEIVERKLAQQQLTETNQQLSISNHELARATRLKDEFLANMSHELRTPLNAILGITEGLIEEVFGSINQQQNNMLQTVEKSGNHLLELINDILDLSKIEAGKLILECTDTNVKQLCQSSIMFVKQQAMQKQIKLEMQISQAIPDLEIDERRIRQVLINLLNNAVKFTPEGGRINLEVTLESVTDRDDTSISTQSVRFSIIDTGIGIDAEGLKILFQPFIQIDSALNRKYEGTGLGLALVKRIVELHGGHVSATSEIGVGSRFMIELPCRESNHQFSREVENTTPSSENPIEHDDSHSKSPLILLAEDNEANIVTISCYLEAKGYRLIVAKDGQQAINLVRSHNPDLILMDIQMPEIDGIEAIKWIRSNHSTDVPIIAITALAMTGDREICLEAGANEYLTKPIKLKQLNTSIQQILSAEKK